MLKFISILSILFCTRLHAFYNFPVDDSANVISSGYQIYLNAYLLYLNKVEDTRVQISFIQNPTGESYSELKKNLEKDLTGNSYLFLLSLTDRKFDILSSSNSLVEKDLIEKKFYPIIAANLKKEGYNQAIYYFLNFLSLELNLSSPMHPKGTHWWDLLLLIIPFSLLFYPSRDPARWSSLIKKKHSRQYRCKPIYLEKRHLKEIKQLTHEQHLNNNLKIDLVAIKSSSFYWQERLKFVTFTVSFILTLLFVQPFAVFPEKIVIYTSLVFLLFSIFIFRLRFIKSLFISKSVMREKVYLRAIDFLNTFEDDEAEYRLVLFASLKEGIIKFFPNSKLRKKIIQSEWFKITQDFSKEIEINNLKDSLTWLQKRLEQTGHLSLETTQEGKLLALPGSIEDAKGPSQT